MNWCNIEVVAGLKTVVIVMPTIIFRLMKTSSLEATALEGSSNQSEERNTIESVIEGNKVRQQRYRCIKELSRTWGDVGYKNFRRLFLAILTSSSGHG